MNRHNSLVTLCSWLSVRSTRDVSAPPLHHPLVSLLKLHLFHSVMLRGIRQYVVFRILIGHIFETGSPWPAWNLLLHLRVTETLLPLTLPLPKR